MRIGTPTGHEHLNAIGKVVVPGVFSRMADEKILGHWIWTATVILVAALLLFPQLDLWGMAADEVYSFQYAGWHVEGGFAPGDVVQAVYEYSGLQRPAYFLLLHFWGRLVGYSILAARLLTVFTTLLSLAMIYRLTSDTVSRARGGGGGGGGGGHAGGAGDS